LGATKQNKTSKNLLGFPVEPIFFAKPSDFAKIHCFVVYYHTHSTVFLPYISAIFAKTSGNGYRG
ncbi:MAG: hypothetical protein IJF10_00570, partial [Clostridia bacterium]|nr:hypothetical protein [Clostridia bacterium]